MTTYGARIQDSNSQNPTRGDTISVTRTVTGVPAGDTLAKAWLTVKVKADDADADAIFQLEITSSPSASGQITDTGADQTGALTFTIAGADYDDVEAKKLYHYDIQLLTTAGVVSTYEVGRVRWEQDVTTVDS